jgi:hypothetical protein
MDWKRFSKFVDAINSYYSFALVVYAAILYVSGHNHVFLFIALGVTPLLAGWGGYILRGYLQNRNQRFGFKLVSDKLTYEIRPNNSYRLSYRTKLKGCTDHLLVYPVIHKWTGKGMESTPQVAGQGQYLLSMIDKTALAKHELKLEPYISNESADGDWQMWFVAFNPAIQKGDTVEVDYSQEFFDKKKSAKPMLYYVARIPMKRLELNVKFTDGSMPKKVRATVIKPTDTNLPHEMSGVIFDPDKQLITWVIHNPKRGYCYRLNWL